MSDDMDNAHKALIAGKISDVLREYALETPDGPSVLLGWVAVVEWKAPDNERWLSMTGADALGDEPPEWQRQGYFHNALFSNWDLVDE
jgi:hypothetical protein